MGQKRGKYFLLHTAEMVKNYITLACEEILNTVMSQYHHHFNVEFSV